MALDQLRKNKKSDNRDVNGLVEIVRHYCADTKHTEFDIIGDDALYSRVCGLYEMHKNIMNRSNH
jgi:hypothetical protein